MNERFYLPDSKLQNIQKATTSAGVMHNPLQLSSTMVMNQPSHQNCFNLFKIRSISCGRNDTNQFKNGTIVIQY